MKNTYKTMVCCGLDPDWKKMPLELIAEQEPNAKSMIAFLKTVIDISKDKVCAYKVQKAFFDLYGFGNEVLTECIQYIHNTAIDVPVILDCKIGDIGNTMDVYLENCFEKKQADGVVLNPYMGDDVFSGFNQYSDKIACVLISTSNPTGTRFQNLVTQDGKSVWQHALDYILELKKQGMNVCPILSSNLEKNYSRNELNIPENVPILFAGVGAQGGDIQKLQGLLTKESHGVFVNSSRGLLYSGLHKDWRRAIYLAIHELHVELEKARNYE